jgi:hypothetical protein
MDRLECKCLQWLADSRADNRFANPQRATRVIMVARKSAFEIRPAAKRERHGCVRYPVNRAPLRIWRCYLRLEYRQ